MRRSLSRVASLCVLAGLVSCSGERKEDAPPAEPEASPHPKLVGLALEVTNQAAEARDIFVHTWRPSPRAPSIVTPPFHVRPLGVLAPGASAKVTAEVPEDGFLLVAATPAGGGTETFRSDTLHLNAITKSWEVKVTR